MSKVYERKRDVLFVHAKALYDLLLKEGLKNPIFADQKTKEVWGRNFGNMIHDMPVLWSGSASLEACARKLANPKYKPSKDHYNSRQRCGEELVALIIKCYGYQRSPTLVEIEAILNRARRVHYVTERENQTARAFMAKQMTPQEAYKKAGIKLNHKTHDLFGRRGRKTVQYKRDMKKKYG